MDQLRLRLDSQGGDRGRSARWTKASSCILKTSITAAGHAKPAGKSRTRRRPASFICAAGARRQSVRNRRAAAGGQITITALALDTWRNTTAAPVRAAPTCAGSCGRVVSLARESRGQQAAAHGEPRSDRHLERNAVRICTTADVDVRWDESERPITARHRQPPRKAAGTANRPAESRSAAWIRKAACRRGPGRESRRFGRNHPVACSGGPARTSWPRSAPARPCRRGSAGS